MMIRDYYILLRFLLGYFEVIIDELVVIDIFMI